MSEELERAVERVQHEVDDVADAWRHCRIAMVNAADTDDVVGFPSFTKADLRLLLSERADLLAAVEKMRGALKPFALAADNMDGDEPDSLFIYDSPESAMIDYADLRRARAALTTGEEK